MADKVIKSLIAEAVKGNTWQKFANPSAARGKTAYPKTSAEQEKWGIRFDYDKEINKDGTDYHMFKMQPNTGKIPSSIKACLCWASCRPSINLLESNIAAN